MKKTKASTYIVVGIVFPGREVKYKDWRKGDSVELYIHKRYCHCSCRYQSVQKTHILLKGTRT